MNEAWAAMLARVEKRRDVDARFYKPTCLIAVIDGIADGSLAPSDLEPDRVAARFEDYLRDLFPDRATLGWRPFWHLSRDGAWIFSKEGRLVGPEDFKPQRKPNSRRELMTKIDLVAVPPALRNHWRSAADRAELRAAVIAMLRRDNDDCRQVADRLDGDEPVPSGETELQAEALAPSAPRSGARSGQGFRKSAAARRALEAQAMKVATAMLAGEGWTVEDVSTRRCYDLHCTRGTEVLFVEVKGTATSGEEVLLTAGEVGFAVRHRSNMMLIVVAEIKLVEREGESIANGGRLYKLPEWAPAPGDLDAVAYRCRVLRPT